MDWRVVAFRFSLALAVREVLRSDRISIERKMLAVVVVPPVWAAPAPRRLPAPLRDQLEDLRARRAEQAP